MSSNRNQHFVVRYYLRRFSFDDGKRIHLFNLASEKYIPEAPLKNQCAADYFYTKDLRGESTLTEIEGIAEDIFKRICDRKEIPESFGERLDLMTILSLMYCRTKRKADLDSDFIELAAKQTIRCSADRQSVELVPILDQVRLRDRAAALRSVKMSLRYPHLLYDLDLRTIIAPEGRSFVTSDHPVVLLNQAFFDIIKDSAIVGLANTGLQIFLPISPQLLLIAFDQNLYRVGSRRRTSYRLERAEDCDLINVLQILNAEENIYFRDENALPDVRALAQKFSPARKKVAESAKPHEIPMPGPAPGFMLMGGPPRIPIPGVWSFCELLKPVTRKDFGLRDPTLCRLIERHKAYLDRTGRLISFDQWLEERSEQKHAFL